MTEKKGVAYRNAVIGVGILCAILLVALAYSVMNYTAMLQDKDRTIASLSGNTNTSDGDTIIADLRNQINQKNAEIDRLNGIISQKDSEIASLNSQINSLKAPKVVKVNLKADDSRPFLGTVSLHVYGELCNVGSNTANNVKLHVVAYQSGGVVAIDTYIVVGSMNGESWTSVNGSPTYGGGALTSWDITPEWT